MNSCSRQQDLWSWLNFDGLGPRLGGGCLKRQRQADGVGCSRLVGWEPRSLGGHSQAPGCSSGSLSTAAGVLALGLVEGWVRHQLEFPLGPPCGMWPWGTLFWNIQGGSSLRSRTVEGAGHPAMCTVGAGPRCTGSGAASPRQIPPCGGSGRGSTVCGHLKLGCRPPGGGTGCALREASQEDPFPRRHLIFAGCNVRGPRSS